MTDGKLAFFEEQTGGESALDSRSLEFDWAGLFESMGEADVAEAIRAEAVSLGPYDAAIEFAQKRRRKQKRRRSNFVRKTKNFR